MQEWLNEAIAFYDLEEYRPQIEACADQMAGLWDGFFAAVKLFTESDNAAFSTLWGKRNKEELFGCPMPKFSTNLLLLAGMKTHQENMKKYPFGEEQCAIQRMRVKKAFLFDYERLGEASVSQTVWGYHFIRGIMVEGERLQFQRAGERKYYLHIPRGGRMDKDSVLRSLEQGRTLIRTVYGEENPAFYCNSWLLSPEVLALCKPESNMAFFGSLFDITPAEADGRGSLFNFLYNDPDCTDMTKLPEDTSLRKTVKEHLLKGEIFHVGMGHLKRDGSF